MSLRKVIKCNHEAGKHLCSTCIAVNEKEDEIRRLRNLVELADAEVNKMEKRWREVDDKLKVAVEALESIMDGRAWKTRTDHINLTPRQLSGIAEDALAKIGGDDE